MTATGDRLPTSARLRRHRRRHSHRTTRLSVRLVLLGALVLLAFAGHAAGSAAPAGGLVAVESANDDAGVQATTAAGVPTVPVATKERIPEFVATEEWKEILPGQGIPRVRFAWA